MTQAKRHLFGQVPAHIIEDDRLRPADVGMYAYLDLHAGVRGYFYDSQDNIAKELAVSSGTLRRALAALESCGYIEVGRTGIRMRTMLCYHILARHPKAHKTCNRVITGDQSRLITGDHSRPPPVITAVPHTPPQTPVDSPNGESTPITVATANTGKRSRGRERDRGRVQQLTADEMRAFLVDADDYWPDNERRPDGEGQMKVLCAWCKGNDFSFYTGPEDERVGAGRCFNCGKHAHLSEWVAERHELTWRKAVTLIRGEALEVLANPSHAYLQKRKKDAARERKQDAALSRRSRVAKHRPGTGLPGRVREDTE